MERIEKAFECAYRKRNRYKIILVLSLIFVLAMQMMMFIGHGRILLTAAMILSALLLVKSEVSLRSKAKIQKRIKKALWREEQENLFVTTIDSEMQASDLRCYDEKKDGIFIFSTKTWLIFVTPNGCLICPHKEIKSVTDDFLESTGKSRLKVNFFDEKSLVFPYEYLKDTLVELIDRNK